MIDLQGLKADCEAAATDKSELFEIYHHHWDDLINWVEQLRTTATQAQEAYINARGFTLRDDRPIREGDPYFAGHEEAYSLFQINPLERHHVFAGNREWAVKQAFDYVKGLQ